MSSGGPPSTDTARADRSSDASVPGGSPADERARGQTLPDFAVAIAIFLITVVFISLFIPQLITPFDEQEQPIVTERIASDLSNSELVEAGTSLHLNESATATFFQNTERDVLEKTLDDTTYSLNITIRDAPSQGTEPTILCKDAGGNVTDCTGDPDESELAIGDPVPQDGQSVATTQRTLFIGDRDVVLEVGVW